MTVSRISYLAANMEFCIFRKALIMEVAVQEAREKYDNDDVNDDEAQ